MFPDGTFSIEATIARPMSRSGTVAVMAACFDESCGMANEEGLVLSAGFRLFLQTGCGGWNREGHIGEHVPAARPEPRWWKWWNIPGWLFWHMPLWLLERRRHAKCWAAPRVCLHPMTDVIAPTSERVAPSEMEFLSESYIAPIISPAQMLWDVTVLREGTPRPPRSIKAWVPAICLAVVIVALLVFQPEAAVEVGSQSVEVASESVEVASQ